MLWIALGLLLLLALAVILGERLVASLVAGQAQERSEWARERGFLLQRIQAPQTAVAQYEPDQEPEPDEPPSEEEMRVFHNEQDEIAYALGRLPEVR